MCIAVVAKISHHDNLFHHHCHLYTIVPIIVVIVMSVYEPSGTPGWSISQFL